jgi:hypothetical protein
MYKSEEKMQCSIQSSINGFYLDDKNETNENNFLSNFIYLAAELSIIKVPFL